MNKEAFIRRLRELLAGIPEQEAAEAIQYYEDYFADAGEENEAKVIEELGSPEKVAANIRADLGYPGVSTEAPEGGGTHGAGYGGGAHGAAGATGYGGGAHSGSYGAGYDGGSYGAAGAGGKGYGSGSGGRDAYEPPKKNHTTLWVVLAVLTCYIWIPLILTAVIMIFVLIVILLVMSLCIGVFALAAVITAVALIAVSCVKMVVSPAGALILLGGGMIIAGLAIFGVILTGCLFGRWLPGFFRWLGSLGRRARRKEGGA